MDVNKQIKILFVLLMYYYVFLSIYLAILLLILERGFSWAEVVSGTHVATGFLPSSFSVTCVL